MRTKVLSHSTSICIAFCSFPIMLHYEEIFPALSFEHPSLTHELGRRYLGGPISHLSISRTAWSTATTGNATVSSLMPHRQIVNFNRPALCHRWLSPSLFSSIMRSLPMYNFSILSIQPFSAQAIRMPSSLFWSGMRMSRMALWPLGWTISGFTVCVRGMKILISEVKETHQLLDRLDEII